MYIRWGKEITFKIKELVGGHADSSFLFIEDFVILWGILFVNMSIYTELK